VSLQRKQTEEGAQFREWKASRLREITQLRREARRNALEHHKLLQEHTKQNAILKRRTEEVWAVQKRMRDGEASRRQRTAARAGTGTAAAAGAPREAWGAGDKGAAAAARAETTSGMLAIGGGGLADAAADKLLEHELAIRLKERSAARELERAVRERAELAALRDGAKERRELLLLEMRSGGAAGGAGAAAHEAELREIDDEAESLEAQLEVMTSARSSPDHPSLPLTTTPKT